MSIDLAPLLASFSIIFLAELGDKTQICAIMLSSRSSALSVFAGALAAFFLVDGVGVLLGGELLSLLPHNLVSLAAGLTFILFGLISFIRKNEKVIFGDVRIPFLKTFSLIALMELGDKTQAASILLAAQFKNPLMVLAGVMLAFSAITGIAVLFGYKILRLIPEYYLKIGTSLSFIIIGLILIIETFFEILLFSSIRSLLDICFCGKSISTQ
jgi:putative Ca2+/H+ antiporter (TMEM165/GDT1 family)